MRHDRWVNQWTEERVAKLRELWPDPAMSCSKIAAELGGGVSRSAVIGKAQRIGLGKKLSIAPQANRRVPKAPRKKPIFNFGSVFGPYTAQDDFTPRAADVIPLDLDILALTDATCKFPYGDPQEGTPYTFCGHPTAPGKHYCPAHFLIAYTAPAARSEKQKANDAKMGVMSRRRTRNESTAWMAEEAA